MVDCITPIHLVDHSELAIILLLALLSPLPLSLTPTPVDLPAHQKPLFGNLQEQHGQRQEHNQKHKGTHIAGKHHGIPHTGIPELQETAHSEAHVAAHEHGDPACPLEHPDQFVHDELRQAVRPGFVDQLLQQFEQEVEGQGYG